MVNENKYLVTNYSSSHEMTNRQELLRCLKDSPLPDSEILGNLGIYLNSKTLSRILFMDQIYKKIVDVQGVVMEFGTRWGQNLALFSALRDIYEPFNRHRKIIGLDTFKGFPCVSKNDGNAAMMEKGALSVTDGYEKHLDKIMDCHDKEGPLAHIKKYELRKGDGIAETEKYLKEYPGTIIALAYFDFDLYEPTKKCLEMIRPHLVKGSILGFDELNDEESPGETIALKEVFGLNNIKLKRYPFASRVSYFIVE